MKGPVIVPLDGSQLAEQALPYGISIARHIGNSLLMVRVIEKPRRTIVLESKIELNVDEQMDIMQSKIESYLQRLAEELRDRDLSVRTMILAGAPPEEISATVEEQNAACIVMATHGRGGFSRWALGSVTDRVVQMTRRPVLVIPPSEADTGSMEYIPDFKRILVPLDGSRLAEQAVEYARELAGLYDAELYLFQVLQPPVSEQFIDARVSATYVQSQRTDAEAYLNTLTNDLNRERVEAGYGFDTGPVADAILSFAERYDADLIVMTTHAREGLDRLILGSVTDRVIRAGAVPVLVARPAIG